MDSTQNGEILTPPASPDVSLPSKRAVPYAASLKPTARDPIYMDMRGDLRLRTTADDGARQDYVVCSRTLARSSPVWNAMLFGSFKESKPTTEDTEWIVSLPHDKSHGLFVILNIVHGHFGLVSRSATLREVHSLLVITEKYNMTEIVRPWARDWLDAVGHRFSDPLLLFVAFELGAERVFSNSVDWFVTNCGVDDGGGLVWESHETPDDVPRISPPDIIDRIKTARLALIQGLLDVVHHVIDQRCGDRRVCDRLHMPRANIGAMECDAMVVGSLTISIRNIWGPDGLSRQASSVAESASSLAEKIQSLTCVAPDVPNAYYDPCNPTGELHSEANNKMERRQSAVTAGHKQFMRRQRMKTGLSG